MSTQVARIPTQETGLLAVMSRKYCLAPDVFERTMAAVAMPQKNGAPDCTREELISCLVVANEHDLNPLTKEIYFMRTKSGVIQPIVSVDGWVKKLNKHPQFDGMEFEDHIDSDGKMTACTVIIYRKDRSRPTKVTEYMAECKGTSAPWMKTERRMLRHRTLTQGARYSIGFAGVMDFDEFEQWQASNQVERIAHPPRNSIEHTAAPDIPEDEPEPEKTTVEHVADPIPDDEPPITDVTGYLDHLRDIRKHCESAEELAEIVAEEALRIKRLPAADQLTANEILAADE
jgi:hypothetical protein